MDQAMIPANKPENAFIFCHSGDVMNNKTIERVIEKYCEQQFEWGIKNNGPTLTALGRITKLFIPDPYLHRF